MVDTVQSPFAGTNICYHSPGSIKSDLQIYEPLEQIAQAAAFDTSVDAVPAALQGIDAWSSETGVYAMLDKQSCSRAAPSRAQACSNQQSAPTTEGVSIP